jgi:hypothetical protein
MDTNMKPIVTIIDDVFDEDYLVKLDVLCKGELLQLDSKTGSHVGEYTDYEWQMIKNDIRSSPDRLQLLNEIGKYIGKTLPTEDLEPMQLFAKKFTTSSHIDKHKEDPNLYGDWVWMLYLTDETDGELCTEDMRILPKRNRLVIMRTGFDHWVGSCSGSRLNLSGWPFVTKQVRQRWKEKDFITTV